MLLRLFSVISLILLVSGCASNSMKVAPSQVIETPPANESQIVFMRSSFVGSAINASLYDVTDGETKFIGIMGNSTKVAYTTTPGDKTFMVVSEAADFLHGSLQAGKTYYSLVTPRMGAWKARFSLWPIKNDPAADYFLGSDDFDGWLKKTKLVVNTPEAQAWYEQNKASVESKRIENWSVWKQKTPEDIAKRTLSPEDGI